MKTTGTLVTLEVHTGTNHAVRVYPDLAFIVHGLSKNNFVETNEPLVTLEVHTGTNQGLWIRHEFTRPLFFLISILLVYY